MGIKKFVRLLPIQIPQFWNEIKLAIVKSNAVDKELIQAVSTEYLAKLLSEKSQCFVAIDEESKLASIIITSILEDSFKIFKFLSVDALYFIQKPSDEDMKFIGDVLVRFAKTNQCKEIEFIVSTDKLKQLISITGARETATIYSLLL